MSEDEESLKDVMDLLPLQITETELAEIMESVIKAIDKTPFGPLISYGGTPEQPKKIISQVAFPLYLETLKAFLSNLHAVRLIPDEPPSDIITQY